MPKPPNPVTYRMRFLWPEEIDAERNRMAALKREWIANHRKPYGEEFDEEAFSEYLDDTNEMVPIFSELPERVPCVELTVRDEAEMIEEAWRHWKEGPRPEGPTTLPFCRNSSRL